MNFVAGYITDATECSLTDVQKVVQEWMRHAGDRLNYKKNQ